MNVNHDRLDEVAALDAIPARTDLPRWPAALRHGEVPREMRTKTITNLQEVLLRQKPITVCVLLYRMLVGNERLTLVLDGNHRLAAAIRLREDQEPNRDTSGCLSASLPAEPPPMRVLAFRIAESQPVTSEVIKRFDNDDNEVWIWNGFNPDIDRIRTRDERQVRHRNEVVHRRLTARARRPRGDSEA